MSAESFELSEAIRRHETGDWQNAQPVYRKILEADPQNAEVVHLYGMSCFAGGDLEEAGRCLRRAILLDPLKPHYFANLAAIYYAQKNLEAAERSCRKAADLDPKNYDAWNNLGGILIERGLRPEAEDAFRAAIELQPEKSAAQSNLGHLLVERCEWASAAAAFEAALKANPEDTDARFNLGVALLAMNRSCEAADAFRACFPARAEDPHAHYNLGMALVKAGRHEEAIASLERCLKLKPDYADAICILGISFLKFRRRAEAENLFREAVRLKPTLALAHNGLALAEQSKGNFDKALEHIEKALACDPRCAPARMTLAFQHLVKGDLAKGWEEYRWIRSCMGFSAARFRTGAWNGEPLNGRTLVICEEQGSGDLIHFIRYAPMAKERGAGQVLLQCSKRLARLMRSAPGVDRVVAMDELLPEDAILAPVLDLPRIFGTTLETIPAQIPYLSSRVGISEALRKALDRARGRKIGLAWRGNPDHSEDDVRSMPWKHFAALKEVANASFFSFQKGAGAEEAAELAKLLPLTDAGAEIGDFAEAARAMHKMDLVISVDTATIHLAGALGKPAWLLLPFVPEWRWLLDRADSPWYPTVRIFRQKTPGDWTGVMREIMEALR